MKTHKLLLAVTALSVSGLFACSHMGGRTLSERFFKQKGTLAANKADRKVADEETPKSDDLMAQDFTKTFHLIQYGSIGKPVMVYKGVKDGSAVVKVTRHPNVTCSGPESVEDQALNVFKVEGEGEVRCQNTAPKEVVNTLAGKESADIVVRVYYTIQLKAWDWASLKDEQFTAFTNAKKSIEEMQFDDGALKYLMNYDTMFKKTQVKIPANKADMTMLPIEGGNPSFLLIDSAEGSIATKKADLAKNPIPVGGMDDAAVAKKFGKKFKGKGLLAPGERPYSLVCAEKIADANSKFKTVIAAREGSRYKGVFRKPMNGETKLEVGCYVNGVKSAMRANVGEFILTVYTFDIGTALAKIDGFMGNEKKRKDAEDAAKNLAIFKGIKEGLKVAADENKETVYEFEKQFAVDKAAFEAAEKARIVAEEKAAADAKKAKEEADAKLAEQAQKADAEKTALEKEKQDLAEQNEKIRGEKREEKKRTVEEMEKEANAYLSPVLYDDFYMLYAKFTVVARKSIAHIGGEGQDETNAKIDLHFENEGYLYAATNGEFDEERASLFTPYKYVPTRSDASQFPKMFDGTSSARFDRLVCAANLDDVRKRVRNWNVNVQNQVEAPTMTEVLEALDSKAAVNVNNCQPNKRTPMYKLPTFKREMKYRFCYRREAGKRWNGRNHDEVVKLVPDRIEASYVWKRKGKAPKREVAYIKMDGDKTTIYMRQKSLRPEKERETDGKEMVEKHPFFDHEVLTNLPVAYLGEGGCADSDFFYPTYETDGSVAGFRYQKSEE